MKTRSTQKKRPVSASSKADSRRCHFTRTDGRRCQMSRTANHATLCLFHARQEQELAQAGQDLSQELVSLSGNLNTATDVNHVLRKLFSLVAQRRISRRDAMAFAYIAQLILQTLPAVKNERQIVMGYDAWQQTLRVAVGVNELDEEEDAETDEADHDDTDEADENDDQDESEENDETDEAKESDAQPSEDSHEPSQRNRPLPQSLAELATMVLARHAKSHGAPPPIRGST